MAAVNDPAASPTKADPKDKETGTLRETDAKFINAVMQNLLGKLEYDTDKVADALGISKKTVSNRWCDLRHRYDWGVKDNPTEPSTPVKATPTKPRKKKTDDQNGSTVIAGRVNKPKGTPRKKKADQKAETDDNNDNDEAAATPTGKKAKPDPDPKAEVKSEDDDTDMNGVKSEEEE